jgi:GNAT superfamily N-acetyltransferase
LRDRVTGLADIRFANHDTDQSAIRSLFWEYLQWANGRVNEEFGVSFDIAGMLERDMTELAVYSPPNGRLVLADEGSKAVGIGCLKRSAEGVGEIKRMYVRPEFRGRGIARATLEALIAEARSLNYPLVRLDSAGFMKEAHSLYKSTGFEQIKPYPESEIPTEFQQFWVFMEKHIA